MMASGSPQPAQLCKSNDFSPHPHRSAETFQSASRLRVSLPAGKVCLALLHVSSIFYKYKPIVPTIKGFNVKSLPYAGIGKAKIRILV